MCLTVPARVLDVAGDGATAVVADRGGPRLVSLVVLAGDRQPVRPGDWILLGAGLAVGRLTDEEAAETLELLDQARRLTT